MRSYMIWTILMIGSVLIMAACGQGQLTDSPEPTADPLTQGIEAVEGVTEIAVEEIALTPTKENTPTPAEEKAPTTTEDVTASLTESMASTPVSFGPTATPYSTGKGLILATPTIHIIPREIPMPKISGEPVDPDQAATLPQVQTAIDDLATRLNIPADSINIVQVQIVVWPNAAMGCPQPGMAYIQVPQDGLFIRLEANGQMYDYHSGGSREPFLCQQLPQAGKITPHPQIDIVRPGSSIGE